MITGVVNEWAEARILVRVGGTDGEYQEISAIVDTGFTGALTLSPEKIQELRLDWIGSQEGTLGDGSIASFGEPAKAH